MSSPRSADTGMRSQLPCTYTTGAAKRPEDLEYLSGTMRAYVTRNGDDIVSICFLRPELADAGDVVMDSREREYTHTGDPTHVGHRREHRIALRGASYLPGAAASYPLKPVL